MRVNLILDDGTYNYVDNPSKRQIAKVVRCNLGRKGNCKVSYGHGFYNEFDFNGDKDLEYKLLPCLEKELLTELSVAKDKK